MPIPFLAAAKGASVVWGMVPRTAKIAMGGALALFVAYQTGHWRGDNHRNAIWEGKLLAERRAQEKIIDDTKDKAINEIARLGAELEKRDAEINDLLIEAEKDADASRPALGASSVQRINRGRAGGPK